MAARECSGESSQVVCACFRARQDELLVDGCFVSGSCRIADRGGQPVGSDLSRANAPIIAGPHSRPRWSLSLSCRDPARILPATWNSRYLRVLGSAVASREAARASHTRVSAASSKRSMQRWAVVSEATGPKSTSWSRSAPRSVRRSPPSASVTAKSRTMRPGS